jgi:SSS family transporter
MYLIFIAVYLLILLIFAFSKKRFVKESDDFSIAGRKLTAAVLVTTLLAGWIGSGTLIAGAEFTYKQGLAGLWMPAGGWVGIFFMYFISKRIRRVELYTAPDILGHFYNDVARLLGSITIIIAYTAIVAYQFRAGGIVLELVTNLPYEKGVLLTAIFVIAYTSVAGMISVAYIDIINGWLIIVASVISLVILIINGGGVSHILFQIQQSDTYKLTLFGHINFIEALGYFIPTLALLLGEASMYQKFFSAKNEWHARMATLGWIIGTVIVETVFVLITFVASSMFTLDDLNNRPESIILYTARHALPVVFGGILLAGGVAILLSTADSFLLAPATSFVKDIYQRFFRKNAKQGELIFVFRLVVVALGIFAYMQISFFKSVLSMAMYAYTMYGASLTPAILAALLMKKVNPIAATSSIIVGMLATLFFEYFSILTGYRILNLPTVIPALFLSIFTLIILNFLFTYRPNKI